MQQKTRILTMITALGIGMSLGWVLPAQETKAPTWKDRAEYDLYEAYSKAADDKGRLAALDKWAQAYADSDMAPAREEMYLGLYSQMKDNRKAFDKAKAIVAKQPNHYTANYTLVTGIYGFVQGANPPAEADLAAAEKAAKTILENGDAVFGPANKPALVADAAAWTALVNQNKAAATGWAQRTNAWVWVQRKNDERAEQELLKVVQADPNQPQFSYMLGTAKLNQYSKAQGAAKDKNLSKVPEAIFHIARAGVYEGPGAIAAATRTAYVNAATSLYKQYHGSDQGFQDVLAAARVGALPPANFKIESITEIQQKEMSNRAEWEKEHPDLAFWDNTIKMNLTGPNADTLWKENFEEVLFPPDGQPFTTFKANIISMTPETNPKEMVVAVFNSNTPDAKLVFEPALGGTMPVGSEIRFRGVGKAFQKDPFMLTFEIDPETKGVIEGWTGVAEKGKAAPKGKAGAKGKAPAKGKGK